MAHDVYISYSSNDKSIAYSVCNALEAKGIECWIAPRDVQSIEQSAEAIVNAITASRIMVLIFSANSNNSKKVANELILAMNSEVIVIPFKIDDFMPKGVMQYYLSETPWLDAMNPPTEMQVERLIEKVKNEFKPCPFCLGDIPARAIKCRYCKSMLDDLPPDHPPAEMLPAKQTKTERRHNWKRYDPNTKSRKPIYTHERRNKRIEAPYEVVDYVHFSVTSQQSVTLGDVFIVDVWAHLEEQRKIVIEQAKEKALQQRYPAITTKGPVKLSRGVFLTVQLKIDDLIINKLEDYICWVGKVGNADFLVEVPEDIVPGARKGLALLKINGLPTTEINFIINVGTRNHNVEDLSSKVKYFKRAFASYASKDRKQVLARVHGMQKALPSLEIFLDVLKLRSGDIWEAKVRESIAISDIFYLFWSNNARNSKWVDKEWRYALDIKGIEFINPVPLEFAPPPPELESLHFHDNLLTHLYAPKWQSLLGHLRSFIKKQ